MIRPARSGQLPCSVLSKIRDRYENLLSSGLADSAGMVAHIRDRLGTTVPPKDLVPENFRTIRAMAAYLQGLQQG